MTYLPVILVIAVATWLSRVGGFHLGNRSLPPVVDRFLGWIPLAAFGALAAPGIAHGPGSIPARLLGAIAAAIVVIRFGPYWAGLLAGMGVFWIAMSLG